MPKWIPKLMMALFCVTGTISVLSFIVIGITQYGKGEVPTWWIVAFAVSIIGIIVSSLLEPENRTHYSCPSCGGTEYDCEEHDDRYGDVPYGCTKTVTICKNCGNTQYQ